MTSKTTPDIIDENFECDCCGQQKCLAGSIEYDGYRLCNDCVLLAETGFALKKTLKIQERGGCYEKKVLEGAAAFILKKKKKINLIKTNSKELIFLYK